MSINTGLLKVRLPSGKDASKLGVAFVVFLCIFGPVAGGKLRDVAYERGWIADTDVMETWEQKRFKFCNHRREVLLEAAVKNEIHFDRYKQLSSRCELDFFEKYPLARENNPAAYEKLQKELQQRSEKESADKEKRIAECRRDVKSGFESGKNEEPRPDFSGHFGRGHDVGSLHWSMSESKLQSRLQKALDLCGSLRGFS